MNGFIEIIGIIFSLNITTDRTSHLTCAYAFMILYNMAVTLHNSKGKKTNIRKIRK